MQSVLLRTCLTLHGVRCTVPRMQVLPAGRLELFAGGPVARIRGRIMLRGMAVPRKNLSHVRCSSVKPASALDPFGVLGWCLLLSHSCPSRPCYAAPRVVTLFTCPLSAVYSVRVQIVSHALLIAHRCCRATSAG